MRPPSNFLGGSGDTTSSAFLPGGEWRAQALGLGPRHALPRAALVTEARYVLRSP